MRQIEITKWDGRNKHNYIGISIHLNELKCPVNIQ